MAPSSSQDPFFEGLSYQDFLPLAWRPMPTTLTAAESVRLNRDNETVLRVAAALDDFRPDTSDESGVGSELGHLDFKLNVLLDLVGHLVTRDQPLPAQTPIRLSARGLEWTASELPAAAAPVVVSLHLQPSYPRPLELPARVVFVATAPDGGRRVQVLFEGLSEAVADGLERLIFRNHRRQIAQSRSAPRADD
ncbi:MAG: hypothetical protein B7Z66_05315 [Chromatiales bacterium 21-64-14]|nr:MAG: hypothetical protein B7Z66_05315 [Chromatiales bacterium 21-64-14]HQU15091.1 PilZ domain-containing protein [Gammaproteobacteria bacterium]